MIQVEFEKTFEGWREQARGLIQRNLPPNQISWSQNENSLFTQSDFVTPNIQNPNPKVSADFLKMAQVISYARDPDRFDLLYRILFRLVNESPHLLEMNVDPDIHRALLIQKSVKRDIHKMHAFVRFKKGLVSEEKDAGEHYVAWHRPEHLIVRPATPFFVRRFGDRKWSIFTPDESAHWDLKNLSFGPGMPQGDFQSRDEWDDVWKTYYKSIFNPARIKMKAMKAEMSPKYWSSMPETALISELIREAPSRLQQMAENHNRSAQVDTQLSLEDLKKSARNCKSCPLYAQATQTVFGEGPERAELMIVGEQPGDQEDLAGKPFCGPAGELLNQFLEEVGLKRDEIYLTNAVKHFKWTPRGKFRLHQKASGSEMHACLPWLEAEIQKVRPKVILALGVTAATAILGRKPQISEERGKVIKNIPFAESVIISWHPSALLRSFSAHQRKEREDQFREDLKLAELSRLSF